MYVHGGLVSRYVCPAQLGGSVGKYVHGGWVSRYICPAWLVSKYVCPGWVYVCPEWVGEKVCVSRVSGWAVSSRVCLEWVGWVRLGCQSYLSRMGGRVVLYAQCGWLRSHLCPVWVGEQSSMSRIDDWVWSLRISYQVIYVSKWRVADMLWLVMNFNYALTLKASFIKKKVCLSVT